MCGFFCISRKKYYITQYNSCAILESYSSRPDRSAREASSDLAIYCHNITKFSTFPTIFNIIFSTFPRIFGIKKYTFSNEDKFGNVEFFSYLCAIKKIILC